MVTLTRTPYGADEENFCGNFSRKFIWEISNGVGPGIIVQRIRRHFLVHKVDVLQEKGFFAALAGDDLERTRSINWYVTPYMSGDDINNYVRPNANSMPSGNAAAKDTDYWEAWYIPPGQTKPYYPPAWNMGGGEDDEFCLCGISDGTRKTKNTSMGKFIITGLANYYSIPSLTDQTFEHTLANTYGLERKKVTAAGGLPARASAPILGALQSDASDEITVVASWDSTKKDPQGTTTMYGETVVITHPGPPTLKELYW